jgi:hypothetical protein
MSDVPDIYTNAVTVSASLYEVTLGLFLVTPEVDEPEPRKPVARVRMSPQQAMALSLALAKNLKVYGEQFTEIFLPDELVMRLSGEDTGETT